MKEISFVNIDGIDSPSSPIPQNHHGVHFDGTKYYVAEERIDLLKQAFWLDKVDFSWGAENTSSSNGAVKVFYPIGMRQQDSGCGFFLQQDKQDEMTLVYNCMFDLGFNFGLGGKMPGIYGGDGNAGGELPDGFDGWSVRLMFHPAETGVGKVSLYVYHVGMLGPHGTAFELPVFRIIPGSWHTIRLTVRVNDMGVSNGIIRLIADNKHELMVDQMLFRKIEHLKCNGLMFHTFFGGNTTSWNSPKNQYANFEVLSI